jgi:uncharacterized cupredoxin-like copper-binding protein
MKRLARRLAIAVLALAGGDAFAHGADHAPRAAAQPMVETAFGRPGDPARVRRTLSVNMSDAMRFSPATLQVKRGDIVRIVVKNDGKAMHELVLGTMAELKAHAELMRKHPGMEHDERYMAHVAPGKSETLVWQFTRSGEFFYGCLIPGHFEAGMIGRITVR